jgi:hypothetical protein
MTTENLDRLIAYEVGELNGAETIELFAELIRSGLAWSLQGYYGRTASRLIELGFIDPNGDIDTNRCAEEGIEI